MKVSISDVCESRNSGIIQNRLVPGSGPYKVFGASGPVTSIDSYGSEKPYVGMVKDGAGVGRVNKYPAKSSILGTMMYLFPKSICDIDYLYYLLDSLDLGSLKTGATIPHVYFKDFKGKQIDLPEIKIQKKRAVELLTITSLIRNREEQLKRLDQLVKSKFVEMFLNGDYPIVALKDLASVSGGLTKNGKRKNFGLKYPYLRVANVQYNALDLSDIQFIGVLESEVEKTRLRSGDLLFVEGNGNIDQVGRVAIWDGSVENCLHQNHLIKARFNQKMLPSFALYYFMTDEGRRQIRSKSVSTTGLNTLTTGKIETLQIPIPPLKKQEDFDKIQKNFCTMRVGIWQQKTCLTILYRKKLQEYFG